MKDDPNFEFRSGYIGDQPYRDTVADMLELIFGNEQEHIVPILSCVVYMTLEIAVKPEHQVTLAKAIHEAVVGSIEASQTKGSA